MAFSDPQSVTIGASTISLPRVASGVSAGSFTASDGNTVLSISNSLGKTRDRRTIRIDVKKVAADPFVPAVNVKLGASVILLVDAPKMGFTPTELKDMVHALGVFLSASSDAATVKLLGGEA